MEVGKKSSLGGDEAKKLSKPSGVAMQIVSSTHQSLPPTSSNSGVVCASRGGEGTGLFPSVSAHAFHHNPPMIIAQHPSAYHIPNYAFPSHLSTFGGIQPQLVVDHMGQLGIAIPNTPQAHLGGHHAIALPPSSFGQLGFTGIGNANTSMGNSDASAVAMAAAAGHQMIAPRTESPQIPRSIAPVTTRIPSNVLPASTVNPLKTATVGPGGSVGISANASASGTTSNQIASTNGIPRASNNNLSQRYPPLLPAPAPMSQQQLFGSTNSVSAADQMVAAANGSIFASRMMAAANQQPKQFGIPPGIGSAQPFLLSNGAVVCKTPTGELQVMGYVAPQSIPGLFTANANGIPHRPDAGIQDSAPKAIVNQTNGMPPLLEPKRAAIEGGNFSHYNGNKPPSPIPSVTQSLPSNTLAPPALNNSAEDGLSNHHNDTDTRKQDTFDISDMPRLIPGESAVGPTDVDIRKIFMAEVEMNAPTKPPILTHVIDDLMIQESSEPFPVTNPFLFDNYIPPEAILGSTASSTPEPPKLELEVKQESMCAYSNCGRPIVEPYAKDTRYCSKHCYKKERKVRKRSQNESDGDDSAIIQQQQQQQQHLSPPLVITQSSTPNFSGASPSDHTVPIASAYSATTPQAKNVSRTCSPAKSESKIEKANKRTSGGNPIPVIPPAIIAKKPEGGLVLVSPRIKEEKKKTHTDHRPQSNRKSPESDSSPSSRAEVEGPSEPDPTRWREWRVDEVATWVRSCGSEFMNCAGKFEEEEVDGQVLALMTDDHMFKSMGIKVGPGIKLSKKLKELKEGNLS